MTVSHENNPEIHPIFNHIQQNSIYLYGLGFGGQLPILNDVIQDIQDIQDESVVIHLIDLTKAELSTNGILDHFIFELNTQIKIDDLTKGSSALFPNVDLSFDEYKNTLSEVLNNLENSIEENKLILIFLNGFSKVYSLKHEQEFPVVELFFSLAAESEHINFIFAVDISDTEKLDVDSSKPMLSNFGIKPIELTPQIEISQLYDQIHNTLSIPRHDINQEELKLLLELTARLKVLVDLLIEEVPNFLDKSGENHRVGDPRIDELFGDIARYVIDNNAKTVFDFWWESLSYCEQILVLVMTQVSEMLEKPCLQELIEMKFHELIGAKVDFSQVIENLEHKNFIRKDFYGQYLIMSEMHKTWVLSKLSLYSGNQIFKEKQFWKELVLRFIKLNSRTSSPLDWKFINELLKIESDKEAKRELETISNPVIMHISDIQFGKAHAFEQTNPEHYDSLLSSLLRDIERNYKRNDIPFPNLIVVSGDIAEWGMPSEFDAGEDFLIHLIEGINNLSDESSISREHVILVPGNHDVNFKFSELGFSADQQQNELYPYRFTLFRDFFNRFYLNKRIYSLKTEEAVTIFDFVKEMGLIITGFNSCHRLDHQENGGHIPLGAIQLAERKIDALINSGKIDRANIRCKIAVWHHDVRLGGKNNDSLQNFPAVKEELKIYNYKLALHGHIHKLQQMYLASGSNSDSGLHVFGAGSVGVRSSQRPGNPDRGQFPLSYNIIKLDLKSDRNRLDVHVREGKDQEESVVWTTWSGWEQRNQLFYTDYLAK